MKHGIHRKLRPSVRQVFESPALLVAFGGGVGLSPIAPGTFGTLAAIPVWLSLSDLFLKGYLVAVALLFVFGCWVCGYGAKRIGVHDHGGIVFDEIVGFLITATPLISQLRGRAGPLWLWLLLAFILFRVFDILKPPPVRWLDRNVGGGLGIMLDDAVAAIPAAGLLAVGLWLTRQVLYPVI